MTNTSPTLSYSLEDFLLRFEQRIDRQFTEINQKLEQVNQKLYQLELGQAEIIGEIKALDQKLSGEIRALDERLSGEINALDQKLSGEIKTLDQKLSGEIKTLDSKVTGIDKRLDNQEFINRGVLVAVIVALLGGTAKFFGWLPVDK